MSSSSLSTLSDYLLVQIFEYLSPNNIPILLLVNSYWYNIILYEENINYNNNNIDNNTNNKNKNNTSWLWYSWFYHLYSLPDNNNDSYYYNNNSNGKEWKFLLSSRLYVKQWSKLFNTKYNNNMNNKNNPLILRGHKGLGNIII